MSAGDLVGIGRGGDTKLDAGHALQIVQIDHSSRPRLLKALLRTVERARDAVKKRDDVGVRLIKRLREE